MLFSENTLTNLKVTTSKKVTIIYTQYCFNTDLMSTFNSLHLETSALMTSRELLSDV